ncbi:hypothetical protein [uncultured Agitococcus sp.]|uniref:hypothetical protein n=1 Tax=uncultured Agitococcus sp. TaxID=1506599 RepID=UPI002628E478|nr:hypothetical protein [uncultured Agitococcus sp.]
MATFDITSPTGEKYRITAPDNATEAEIMQYAQANFGKGEQTAQPIQAPKINKDEARGRALPSPAQGFINAVSQAPLGFGDEIYGALGGLGALVNNAYGAMGGNVKPVGIKDAYLENRDLIRGAQKQYSEDYPTTAMVTGMMAGAPLMAVNPLKFGALPQATSKVQAAFNAAKLAGQAGATGAVFGGAYGAGTSEGEDASTVAGDTLKGGGVGLATGLIAQPVLSAVGGLGKNAAIRMFGDVRNTGGINQGGQVGAIDPIGALSDKSKEWIRRQGDAKIAEAIAQTGRARSKNIRLMPNGDEIPYSATLANKVDKMPVGTPMAALSGQKSNELRSLDAVSLLSGRTAPAVADVQGRLTETAGKRFLTYADKILGGGKPDFNKSIAALNTKATVESKPFYQVLDTVKVPIDDEVRNLVTRANAFVKEANSISQIKGDSFADIRQLVKPNSGATEVPLMRLELLKRAMNDAEETLKRSGGNYKALEVGNLRRDLMAKLESASPVTPQGESIYRLANQKFAEPKQLIDAVEEGSKLFKRNHMDIRDYKATLNDPQKQAYEIGVFRALEEKMGTPSGRNFLSEISKDRNASKVLLEAMGKERFRQFAGIMKGEKALKSIYTVNTGSQTAQREAALSELGLDPLKDAGESAAMLMSGSPVGAMGKAAQAWNKISTPEQVRDYMGARYLQSGKQAQDYLKTLGDLIKQIETSKSQSAVRKGTLGGLGYGNSPKDNQ